jgi:hypothetical protein
LPITSGGGSNLKTPEALISEKFIISTKFAFRGFDNFINDNGVFIASNSSEFKRTLNLIMAKEPLTISDIDKKKRASLLWKNSFKPLSNFISNFL